jgi:hypothetical protein
MKIKWDKRLGRWVILRNDEYIGEIIKGEKHGKTCYFASVAGISIECDNFSDTRWHVYNAI